jgi:nitrogen fixation protein NifU and related proteins
MSYSDQVIDHFERPRNAGAFAKDESGIGFGLVGAPARGEVIRLQIKVGGRGLIEDTRFKAFGGATTIAAASLVSEWIKGRTLAEAVEITNTEIACRLALAPVQIRSAALAEDAINAAIADYRMKHG